MMTRTIAVALALVSAPLGSMALARDGDAVAKELRPAVHVAGTPHIRWTVAERLATRPEPRPGWASGDPARLFRKIRVHRRPRQAPGQSRHYASMAIPD